MTKQIKEGTEGYVVVLDHRDFPTYVRKEVVAKVYKNGNFVLDTGAHPRTQFFEDSDGVGHVVTSTMSAIRTCFYPAGHALLKPVLNGRMNGYAAQLAQAISEQLHRHKTELTAENIDIQKLIGELRAAEERLAQAIVKIQLRGK